MALTQPIGFICYNNSELVRDGYIEAVEATEIDPDDFDFRKLTRKSRKGITYQLVRDDPTDPDKITKIIERRKLLPAEKIKIEIQFGKTLKNAVTHPISPGIIPGFGGFIIGNLFTGIGFGGITSGYTYFVYDIIDSGMIINERITITQEILDSGIITFDSFPVSIFGIVKEYQEELIGTLLIDQATVEANFLEAHPQGRIETDIVSGIRIGKVGLDFQIFPGATIPNQVDRIGQHSRGSYEGGPRKRIDGGTDSKGQFGEIGIPYLQMVQNLGDSGNPPEQEVVFLAGQKNIFLEIIRDHRKLKFRGDNRDATGQRYYPFENRQVDDITDHDIRINVDDLILDDVIYITYCASLKRRVRQAMRHKGIVGQGNTFGVSGWNLEIGSEMDIFDFQIKNWMVPNIVPNENAPDDEFKITFNQYKDWKIAEENFNLLIDNAPDADAIALIEAEKQAYFDERFDVLEGWRMSSIITTRLEVMWAADYRGIVLMGDKREAVVVVPVTQIRDQDWFLNYVKGLPFIEKHEDPVTGDIIYDNLEIKIDDAIEMEDMSEAPIDIGSPTNEILFDREKIPYYREFALALQNVSLYNSTDLTTGIGVPALDLALRGILDDGLIGLSAGAFYASEMSFALNEISNAFLTSTWTDSDLKYSDLSFSNFQWSQSMPNPSQDCIDGFSIHEHHYTCHIYDPSHGPGIWFNTSYIENQLFEWRPPGGFIESYWKMDTPYFCGEFGRTSRIYIEFVGGNSLDNNSWIYVDTWPNIPETISMDKNLFLGKSYLTFYDNDYLDSASYHIFSDATIDNSFRFLDVNTNKTQLREFLDANDDETQMIEIADAQRIIGYNNILGDIPSFSNGRVLTNDVSYICHNSLNNFWTEVDILNGTNPSGQVFELDFTDNIPRIKNIPVDWAIKEIQIEFRIPAGEIITTDEAYATLYFEDNDVSINNFLISPSKKLQITNSEEFRFSLDCQYYNSRTIQLLGKIWKKIDIISLKAVVADTFNLNDIKIKEGQTSIIDDGLGRLAVFFADSNSGNISIILTYNEGRNWTIYRDIIRLTSDEIATFPVTYQENESSPVHLFYVLNDAFLMHRTVELAKLDCDDSWVNYSPPDFYDDTSNDDDPNNANSSLSNFTENGKSLRKQISYFVDGNSENNYFIDQMNIKDNIKAKNALSSATYEQSFRFDYVGDFEDLNTIYNGEPFGVHRDNSGVLRIFYAGEEGLTIKMSTSYSRWEYLAKNLPLHKTYLTDDIKEENNPIVTNIQIARNYYDEEDFYLFYFYRGMLLMRTIPSGLLQIQVDADGNKDDTILRKFLKIDVDFHGYRPIFISGHIPEEILNLRVKELELQLSTGQVVDSDIAIYFPYGIDDIKKFNNNFELDTSTQVFAYTTENGAIRAFYKDAFGNLNGSYINGNNSTPEIFYEVKQELIK